MIVCLTKIWNPIIHPHIATKKVIGSNVFDPTTGHVLENVFFARLDQLPDRSLKSHES
jgi:hypothetical protein